ncbi:MAG: NPP1 family protein [Bacteroidota bacterium]
MKTKSLLLSMALLCLIFTQCRKQDHLGSNDKTRPETSSAAKDGQASALVFCAECQESGQKITGTTAQNLANTYAPLVKFDRAAPDYPISVEDVFNSTNPSSIVCNGTLVMTNRAPGLSKSFPTYYEVQQHPTASNKVFIDFWWTYKTQTTCFAGQGGHDYDWEHTVLQVNTQTNRVLTVTYFQHGGWYTKDWRNVAAGTRVDIFVGKKAHGSYHNRNTISFPGYDCSYYGDYRNPNGSADEVQSWNNLVAISCTKEQFSFNGYWGGIGKGPLYRSRDYWNFAACNGSAGITGTDGCSQSSFAVGTQIGSIN